MGGGSTPATDSSLEGVCATPPALPLQGPGTLPLGGPKSGFRGKAVPYGMWSPPVAVFDPGLNLRRSNCGSRGVSGRRTADEVTAACVPGRGCARGVRPIDARERAAVGATSGRPRGEAAARARGCRWRGRTWATQTKVVPRDPARSRLRIRQGRRAPAGGRIRWADCPEGAQGGARLL